MENNIDSKGTWGEDRKFNIDLKCPKCDSILQLCNQNVSLEKCTNCQFSFNSNQRVLSFIQSENNSVKKDIQTFWAELYKAAYHGHSKLFKTKDELVYLLKKLEQLFVAREHLAVMEMPLHQLKSKKVLEIGPGAGAHSALFSYYGAQMVSLDITLDRVLSTDSMLTLLNSGPHLAVQGDAENLPFADNTFDIVYSNGVLHHTPDTQKTIQEVFRVLKPGGEAVIMLYAKHSYLYWINIFFLRGILQGNIFRQKNWLGRVTEWMSDRKQKIFNPETKVFTENEIKQLFQKFHLLSIRKNSFVFNQIPFIGKIVSKILGKIRKPNPAGFLIYDQAWREETKLELFLSRYIGFCLNIKAKKPEMTSIH